ncbi:MAG TPA: hypothetical protein VGW32_10905, partial [Pyrinomonadaceae bacterium]|nr:hypothetical protein [Pyrinomonadaceae bacterium]
MIRHIITSEYPPQPGGVSDYTRIVAEGLAAAGDEVHVWCPAVSPLSTPRRGAGGEVAAGAPTINPSPFMGSETRTSGGVFVHSEMSGFAPCDLRRTSRLLNQFPAPRRVLVQWVPHGYGCRSMNLVFCLWLWLRSLRGDRVELMVHEPSLGFGEGSWKHNVVAFVHRLMTI